MSNEGEKAIREVDTKPIGKPGEDECDGRCDDADLKQDSDSDDIQIQTRPHPEHPHLRIPREGLPCSFCWQMVMGTLEELKMGQRGIKEDLKLQKVNLDATQVEVRNNRVLIQHLMKEVLGENGDSSLMRQVPNVDTDE